MEREKACVLDRWIKEKYFRDEPFSRILLEEWQLKQIQNLLSHVRSKSCFYREFHKDLPRPETMEDFSMYPLMDSNMLRTRGAGMLCVSQKEISRVVTLTTSGTTRTPKRIFFTPEDQELTLDFFANGMLQLVSPGESTAVCLPYKTEGCVGDLLIRALARKNVRGIGIGLLESLPEALNRMQREEPDTAVGVPAEILELLEYANARGVRLSFRRVLTSTDLLPEIVRKKITEFGVEVFDHLGMTECGLGVALECGFHRGMHIRENDLYMEIIDEKGSPVADGVFGEITVTTLTRRGMPMIRYRTGDRGRILPGICACNSILRRVEITGRLQ